MTAQHVRIHPLVSIPTATGRWERDEGKGEGEGGGGFPPGDHPLQGVPNLEDLAAPETLSAKVDLSEVNSLVLYK